MPETGERGHVDKAKNGKKAGMRAAERGTSHRCDARSEMRARVVLRGIFGRELEQPAIPQHARI